MLTRLALAAAVVVAAFGPIDAAAATAPDTSFTNYDLYYNNAEFWFRSDLADATFECSLDGALFSACTSPVEYTGLNVGEHHFEVRAVASDGTVDPWPANMTWTHPSSRRLRRPHPPTTTRMRHRSSVARPEASTGRP